MPYLCEAKAMVRRRKLTVMKEEKIEKAAQAAARQSLIQSGEWFSLDDNSLDAAIEEEAALFMKEWDGVIPPEYEVLSVQD
jgi:hypothetical protein